MKQGYRHNKATPSLSRAETQCNKRNGEKRTRREGRTAVKAEC